jgi:hypothetical protein
MTDQSHVRMRPPSEDQIGCQIPCLDSMQDPNGEVMSPPLAIRLRLKLTRRLNPRTKRAIIMRLDGLLGSRGSSAPAPKVGVTKLQAGDLVRVRSREEIEATLNFRGQLRGCKFLEAMVPYCGTTQRVLKPAKRFFDERDHRLKKCKGVLLLEGAMCQGTAKFGRCDRSCFYFWREEWLEKVD